MSNKTNDMKTINEIKDYLNSESSSTIRIEITTLHKYGIEKRNEIRIWSQHNSKVKNYTITNLETMSDKHYETDKKFYMAINRLLKKQVK